MGVELPASLQEPLSWTGEAWPAGDEDELLAFSEAWQTFAERLARIAGGANDTAQHVADNNDGAAAEAFEQWWRSGGGNVFVPQGPGMLLARDERAAVTVAALLSNFADQILALKSFYLDQLPRLKKYVELFSFGGENFITDLIIARAARNLENQNRTVAEHVNSGLRESFEEARRLMTIVGKWAEAHAELDQELVQAQIDAALDGSNPHFPDDGFTLNCTSVVIAYELRRRGLDVEALALPDGLTGRNGAQVAEDVFGREVTWTDDQDDGVAARQEIEEAFRDMGPGARGIIRIAWDNGGGHVFNVENVNGEVVFVDGQNNRVDVADYFERGSENWYVRTDDADMPEVSETDEYAD